MIKDIVESLIKRKIVQFGLDDWDIGYEISQEDSEEPAKSEFDFTIKKGKIFIYEKHPYYLIYPQMLELVLNHEFIEILFGKFLTQIDTLAESMMDKNQLKMFQHGYHWWKEELINQLARIFYYLEECNS